MLDALRRLDAVPKQELGQPMASTEEVDLGVIACPDQVAQGFVLRVGNPDRSQVSVAQQAGQVLPQCRSLILTTFGKPGFLRRAMESGVYGFLLKDAPPEQLAMAIRRTARGEHVVDPGLATSAISEGVSPLTERERQVLAATDRGADLDEIARRLFLSRGTVRNHLSNAIQKLGARNRSEAARIAGAKGWL